MRFAGDRSGNCDRPHLRRAGEQFCCEREPAVRLAAAPFCQGIPTDGPDGWFRPFEEEHFAALGLNTPNVLWLCQNAAADNALLPTIGAVSLPEAGSGHVYQQTETGWDCFFVGFPSGTGTGWRETLANIFGGQIGAGESFAMAAYARIDATATNERLFHIGGANGIRFASSADVPRTVHGGAISNATGSHAGAVRQWGWYRRADTDASGMVTDLENIGATHDEAAIGSSATAGLGSDTTAGCALVRCCWLAMWKGANAEFSMSAALAALRGA